MIRMRRICRPLTVEGGFTLLEVLVASAVLGRLDFADWSLEWFGPHQGCIGSA